ncbi:MAG TPA: transposase family protein [Planctomycetota bacterium]|nr:transposase family protein [Planctomycetota bacterium]
MRAAGLRALAEQGLLLARDHQAAAAALDVSVRTVQLDLQECPAGPSRRPGRPGHDARHWWTCLHLTGRVLHERRWHAGWRDVVDVHRGQITTWEAQRCTQLLKKRHKARRAAASKRSRVSIEVLAPDVMWALDAKHLSRDRAGTVTAEVVLDPCPRRRTGAAVGRPASGKQVVALLEGVRRRRGQAPLVLVHDNAKTYCGAEVAGWCEQHGVLSLCNLPHTPQHNPFAERGMRELGEQTGLGRGVRDVGILQAGMAVAAAIRRMNSRPRRVLGGRSADDVDALGRVHYTRQEREELADEVRAAQLAAMRDARGARARRRACRNALLEVLERRGWIKITRGGSPGHARRGARVS